MKNRVKLLNSLLIILSIFILGIINVYAKEIEVESFDVVDKSDTISVEQLNYTNDTVSSNIKFNQQDDYVIFGLNLKNNGSKKYKIVSITDNNTNNNIQITYNYSNESFNTSEVTDISIKMLYKNKLINVSEKNINDLKITILLEDDLGNQEQISVNPFTGDHIYLYLIIFIISGGSLIIIIKGHKKARFVLLLTFLLIPCSIFALEQYKINILFDDIVVKGELENYNVVIDDGNNNSYDVVVEYGKKIPSLPTPSKDGYTFKEWQDEDGNVVTTDTIITKSLHLTAIYDINHYQITYSLDDGVVSNPDDYTIEDNITLNNPSKSGYIFVGWTGSNGDTPQLEVTIPTGSMGDKNYTANYIINDHVLYTVIHKTMNLDGKTYSVKDTDELYGTAFSEVTPALKNYEGFTSPSAKKININPNGSSTVEYLYTRNKYTLTLQDTDYIDTTFSSGEYYYGTEINVKAKDKTGYTFVKWSDNTTSSDYTFNISNDITLKPIYTANIHTPYKVIHKKMNVTGDAYFIYETDLLEGASDTFVTPLVKDYYGFTAPAAQEVKIKSDGSTEVTYYYQRNKFTLTLEDSDYINTTFNSGEYYYETEISVKAKNKTGYTFVKWSDNSTDINHTFNLNDNTTIKPIYSANSNTAYKVIHKKMNIDGVGYTVAETENLEGTSDTFVTPAVKNYEGFTAPTAQEIKIKADGTASIEYLYARNQYTLTITNEEYVDTTTYSGLYYYGTNITLSPKSVPGYKFNKWSNDSTSSQITFSILTDTTIGPIFDANSYSIRFDPNVTGATGSMDIIDTYYGTSVALPTPAFELDNYIIYAWNTKSDGTGVEYGLTDSVSNLTTSDGVTVTLYALWEEHLPSYSHVAPIEFDGQTIIDTHMKLFNESNYMKNFEISFDIDNIDDDRFLNSGVKDTIVNSIHEVTPWPGTAFRIDGSKYGFVGTNGTVSKKPTLSKDSINKSVKILRIGQKLYYKVDNNQPVLINDFSGFNLFFEDTVTLGGTLEADGVTPKPSRYFKGTISNISIRFLPNSVTIDDYDPTSNLKIVYSMPESHSFDGTPATMLTPTYENEEGEFVPFRFFTEENIGKDFYISFDLDNYVRDGQVNQATLLNIKYENEAAGYPGYVLRVINNNTKFHSATSLGNVPNKKTTTFNDNISSFYVQRIDGVIGYGYDNSGLILLDDFSEFTDYFDTPLTLGDNGSGDRCMKNTTISNLLIKIGD